MNSIVRRNVPEALSVEEVRKEYQKNASQTMHPPFQSREFAEYAKTQRFRHRNITPSHPEANGEAERFVKTLQKFITTTTVEASSWRMSLPDFLRVYRSTPLTGTGRNHILNSSVEEKCVAKFLSSALAVKTLKCDRKTLWQSKK